MGVFDFQKKKTKKIMKNKKSEQRRNPKSVPEHLPLLLNNSFVLKNKASKTPYFAYIPAPNLVGEKKGVRK